MIFGQKHSSVLFVLALLLATTASANDLSILAGYFQIESKTSNGKTILNNPGIFDLVYEIPLNDHLSFRPGYSFYVLGSSSIELGYGIDLEMAYYPFSLNRKIEYNGAQMQVTSTEVWRPYVGMSFNQRQYQSINSSYAGIGLDMGTNYQISEKIYLSGKFRFLILRGPLTSDITDINIMGGIGVTM